MHAWTASIDMPKQPTRGCQAINKGYPKLIDG